eukprot:scaffold83395_cov51-Attheya_sp.AAC.4
MVIRSAAASAPLMRAAANTARHVMRRQNMAMTWSGSDRLFSTARKLNVDGDEPPKHSQDFVTERLEPQEWDEDRTDPTYRPKWKKGLADIVSPEDFAERPRVGFDEEFDSLWEAMVTLCWLSDDDTDAIYQSYLNMMTSMHQEHKVTSHEYVMYVLAQRFHLLPARVSAIIQLKHNEEQFRKDPTHIMHTRGAEVQAYVDQKIKEQIDNAYSAFEEEPPNGFVEDSIGVMGLGARGGYTLHGEEMVEAKDLFDMPNRIKETLVRERDEAQLVIDTRIYKEDISPSSVNIKINNETRKLMKTQKQFSPPVEEDESLKKSAVAEKLTRGPDLSPMPENGTLEERRPRWKFAAKTVNQREWKANLKKKKKHQKDMDENVLIEENGQVRVATRDEYSKTSWKPKREFKQFIYKGAQDAWIRRNVDGEVDGWGRVETPELPKTDEEQTSGNSSSDSGSDSSTSSDSSDSSDSDDGK